jgi:hypothetical protein
MVTVKSLYAVHTLSINDIISAAVGLNVFVLSVLVASFIENLVGAAGAIDIGCIILVCK